MDTAEARQLHDDLLASKPDGAKHNADICPFCVEAAQEKSPTSRRRADGPDVSENQSKNTEKKGGTSMSDISQEAHDALVAKAVKEATAATEKALETKTSELDAANGRVKELEGKVTGLEADNSKLNGELDAAQVAKKAAEDKASELEKKTEEQAEKARLTEVASKRVEQVKNLKTFDDEFVAERASHWATLSDEEWDQRIGEWAKLKPADTAKADEEKKSDTAMSGTSEDLTKEPEADKAKDTTPSARRAALGLV